ncbi:MAG TPA: tetratricopeptide repeat protein [Ktedonobacterales bacterium]|jgi:predicted ATPase/DNA-binding XRE family transcriptional regulator
MSAAEPSFGALLKEYRLAAGLTQEALAERAGLSARAISDLERGVNRTPRQETLDLLAQALRLPPRKRALLAALTHPEGASTGNLEAEIRPPHNLPVPLTLLVGRESDVTRATRLLERKEVRLLTLTGPSGVGKTRLGLQVADDLLERFDDGVWLVELAAIRDPALIAPSIAQALGLREAAGQAPPDLLKTALREQQRLLLLDNFEQVAQAAPLVAELLGACPRLKVLVTSRAALHLRGEQELPLVPLGQEAAVTLFLQRAQAVQPDLDLTVENIQAAGAICRHLDGLPLAIELAAARVKVLPPQALLERLKSRLPLLTGGPLDLPERQRTMRDAVAWSYALLNPAEQQIFRRLAVFSGGSTLEAAAAICHEAEGGAPPATWETIVLEELTALVDHSLISSEMAAGKPRFTLLEIIREYALERLEESSEAETLRRRHLEYYTSLAEEAAHIRANQDARDTLLAKEFANVRAALEWAREHGESAQGLRLASACGRVWYFRGMLSEAQQWLDEFLALDACAGERAAPGAARVQALYGACRIALDQGSYDRVETLSREGLALAKQADDQSGMGNALAMLAAVAEARGNLAEASALYEEGLAYCRDAGDSGGTTRILSSLGHIERATGQLERARVHFEEILAHARKIGLTWGIANSLVSLGHIAREQGDHQRALVLYREGLALHQTMGNNVWIAWCLEGMAATLCDLRQFERAARLCGIADALRASTRALRPPAEQEHYEQLLARVREALGEEAFASVWAAGDALSLKEAVIAAQAESGLQQSGSGGAAH